MAFDVRAGQVGRLASPGARQARYLPIAEHGLMGDLHTVALVGTDGTIDWYCCSRFDLPSIFARAAEMRVLRGRALPAATSVPFSPLAESTVRPIVMALAPPSLKNRQRPEPLREGAQLLAVARPSAAGPDHRSACCAGRGCTGGTTILTSPESRS